MPAEAAPKRRIETIKIPGRSGDLHVDENAYDSVTLTAVLNLAGRADVRAVMAWLDGRGDLVLSDSAQYRRKAVVIDGVPFKRRRLHNGEQYDSFTVKFDCDPFLYQVDPQATPLYEPFTLVNQGALPAEPLLRVYGRGNVVLAVGDVSVTLTDLSGAVAIDCDAKLAYTIGANTPVAITLNDEKWPVLGLGGTRISWSGQVEKVIVEPNWRWL